ncbi:hypothetical protein D3C87_998510 [compost metagenome]
MYTDSDLKKEIINDLKLEANFDFNGLRNLVPAHSSCNTARKGKFIPTSDSIAGTLIIIERHIPKILEIKEKLDNSEKYDEDVAKLATHLEKGNVTPEELYDSLCQDDRSFNEVENFELNQVRISTKNVLIHCHLPVFPEIQGSMLIAFRSLRISDCFITFSHKEIVERLFQGIGSPPSSSYRDFIVTSDLSKNVCAVQLGNNRFTISIDEVKQLCELIDKVAPSYLNAVKSIETAFRTTTFSYSPKKRFRLLKISRSLWRNMLDFAREHDYEKGNSEWHIFDGKASYLKIFCKLQHNQKKDYRLFIYPEAEEERLWDSFAYPDNEVWLCWEPSILLETERDVTKLQNNLVWNAEYSFNWIRNVMIPVVIDYYKLKQEPFIKKLFKYRGYLYSPFHRVDISLENASSEIEEVKNITSIKTWIDKVQSFFAVHSSHYVSVQCFKGVYEAILLGLKFFELNESTLLYINTKLDGQGSIETISNSVEQKIAEAQNKKGVNGSSMEYAMRSLCAILREGKLVTEEYIVLDGLASRLTVLSKEYNILYELERTRLN